VLCGALPARGGCYDTRAAPGSGVCREARGGACVGYVEEVRAEKTSAKVGVAGAEETPTCDPAPSADPVSKKCAQNKCDVTIGGNPYCSQCSKPDEYLIDGACVTTGTQDANTKCIDPAEGKCASCGANYFLYKGGCYSKDAAPGQTMCTAVSPNGVCSQAAEGYFVPPGADATHDSVVSCGDSVTGVTIGGNKKYIGIENCAKCTKPGEIAEATSLTTAAATCTECTGTKIVKTVTASEKSVTSCIEPAECKDGYFVDTSASSKKCTACTANCNTCSAADADKCSVCAEGYFVGAANNAEGPCVSCDNEAGVSNFKGVANCAKCTKPASAGAATCTECAEEFYLKATNPPSCVTTAQCTGGYFPTTDSASSNKKVCISCDDGTNGVTDCTECTAPTQEKTKPTCTKCSGNNYLKTVDGATTCVEKDTCKDGFFPVDDSSKGNKCVSCGDTTGVTVDTDKKYVGIENCAKCTKPDQLSEAGTKAATCTECNANLYLKTVTGSSTETSCVTAEDCNTGYFPNDNVENKKKCILCNTVADGGITNCGECSLLTSASRAGAILITCTKCTSNKLSPLKDACLTACPAGTYDDNSICKPCHVSCAECNGNANQDSCTACYPGSVLSRATDSSTTGTCIPECTGRYAENCEANQCTATIAGSKYCSKCKSGFVPVDGLCVSATARAPTGCTPKGDGTCSACTDKYFLQSGGCYLSTAYPGSTLCSQAASGKCKTCTNTQTADPSTGVCPACPAGCSKCSGNSPSQQCSECLAGYYLDSTASKCVKCSETSGNIQGVPNCVSCAAPTTSGPVTCYVTQQSTDPSVNKTGLSSGAIAGISVAVIAVVGGLVGFLCWWFICRGKA
ncbi:Variant-specific surface protein, partial [Giardia duodenalis]